jgi:hypothetical protein
MPRKLPSVFIVCAVLVGNIVTAGIVLAQDTSGTGSLSGTIRDTTNASVAYAPVCLSGITACAVADGEQVFQMRNIRAGEYALEATAPGEPVACKLAGQWLSEDTHQKVQFVSTDGAWSGRLVWTSKKDPPVGSVMFQHFVYDAKHHRYRGELVSPAPAGSGNITSADLRCTDADTITVLVSRIFMQESIVWHRTNDQTDAVFSSDTTQPVPSPTEGRTAGRKWRQRFNLSVGPGIGMDRRPDDAAGSDLDVGFTLVRRRGSGGMRSGFGMMGGSRSTGFAPMFRFALRSTKTATVPSLDSDVRSYGDVTIRPILGGLSWSHELRPKWTAELFGIGGYSFNGFAANTDGSALTKGPRILLPASVATVNNSFASEVGARLGYDVRSRIALTTSVSFLHTRPQLTLTDGSTRMWDGNRFHLDAGIAFTLFGRPAKKR